MKHVNALKKNVFSYIREKLLQEKPNFFEAFALTCENVSIRQKAKQDLEEKLPTCFCVCVWTTECWILDFGQC